MGRYIQVKPGDLESLLLPFSFIKSLVFCRPSNKANVSVIYVVFNWTWSSSRRTVLQFSVLQTHFYCVPRVPSIWTLQTTSSALKGAIQLGITHSVGSLSQKPERDVLMQDFEVVESIFFPRYACLHKSNLEEPFISTSHTEYINVLVFVFVLVKAATQLQVITMVTSSLKHTLPLHSATLERCLGSDLMTTW